MRGLKITVKLPRETPNTLSFLVTYFLVLCLGVKFTPDTLYVGSFGDWDSEKGIIEI